ncbi:MAG: HD domain-containing protein [Nanoarchaeota archaeon]
MEKGDKPAELIGKTGDCVLDAFLHAAHLKQVYRKGWTRFFPLDVVESDADHSFGVAILAYLLAKETRPDLDADKVLRIATFHELAESITGDVIPADKIPVEEKDANERRAMHIILDGLKSKDELMSVWNEIETRSTPEGTFVKDVDYLEMCIQALIYEKQHGVDLQEFYDFTLERLRGDDIIAILRSIMALRTP